jgi:TetR/AcrR family transcriptional regulator, transcriptional repressor for nem operon
MARPREFDTGEVLDRAMGVFWDKGYEATTLCDLIAAMGLSRSSLYDTFGNKHELFLATIDRYNATVAAPHAAAAIAAGGGGRAGIDALFRQRLALFADGDETRGCFLGKCASEAAPHDPGAARRVSTGLRQMEDILFEAVRAGQRRGEIATRHDARTLARYLSGNLNGLNTLARSEADSDALGRVVDVVLAALD